MSLFTLLILFQLVPLPPSVIEVLSPSTYEVYTRSLPGWPDHPPYERLLVAHTPPDTQEEGGGVGEWERGRPGGRRSAVGGRHPEWLPLSLAPALTKTDLLKFTAYAALFFLILCYPLGVAPASQRLTARSQDDHETSGVRKHRRRREDDENPIPDPRSLTAEQIFARKILFTVMICGFIVAVLGFVNLFTWNGRILWLFQPYDEGAGAGAVRASAPFISPDTFANYLAIVFPLFVVGTFYLSFLSLRRFGGAFRVFYGFGMFIIVCSLLLSLSRAGWGATALGVGVLLFLLAGHAKKRRSGFGRAYGPSLRRLTVAAVSAAFVGALLYVGPQGRQNVDLRLTETLEQKVDFFGRATIWRDAVGIVRDFPLLGVGLGSWPELFPRYQNPQLGDGFYREAHNDYLEVLSETGIVGFAFLAWFFWVCFAQIFRGLGNLWRMGEGERERGGDRTLNAGHRTPFSVDRFTVPVVAALLAGMCAMAFHAIFDFNLQIPANALLFTVFLALGVRLTGGSQGGGDPRPTKNPRPNARRLVALLMGFGALALMREAFTQEMLPYPHNLTLNPPETIAQAIDRIRNYPAQSDAHLYLFQLLSSPTRTQERGRVGDGVSGGSNPQPPKPNTEVAESRTNADDSRPNADLVVPRRPTRAKSQASTGDQQLNAAQRGQDQPPAPNIQEFPSGQSTTGVDTPVRVADLLSELEAALWLEPKNTRARDVYAAYLIREGRLFDGLTEVSRSVRDAPSMNSHFYLARNVVSGLGPLEQDAIERGFKEAMGAGDERIMDQLGQFYSATKRFGQKAALFEDAAALAEDPGLKEKYLIQAAYTNAEAGDFATAEDLFYEVLKVKPDATAVYQQLIDRIFKPRQDMDAVREIVVEGIARGADAFTLYLVLAEASRANGEFDTARAAAREASQLLRNGRRNGSSQYSEYIRVLDEARRSKDLELAKALLEEVAKLAPSTYRELYRLGTLYAQVGNYDRAGYYFRRATQANPGSANAFYQLALIEERNFRFHVADSAYANAVRLDPDNQSMRERYNRFKKRVRSNRPQATGHRPQAPPQP